MIYYSYIDRFERKLKSSKNNKVSEIFSNAGTSEGNTYEYQFIDGIKSLVVNGKTSYQDLIDSFAESQDINVMISKFLNGDTSVLNPAVGTYGDFRNLPDNYADLFTRVQQCKNIFDSLPVDIKESFDNSAESFWTQFGNDRFNEVFDKFLANDSASVADVSKESEVVDNAE